LLSRISFLLVALSPLLPFSAAAQQYAPVVLLTGGTQNISAAVTSNYTAVVNVRSADTVAIHAGFKMSGAGTDDVVFSFAKSADGAIFETTPSILITNTPNGGTRVEKLAIVDVTGVHTIKLVSIANASATRYLTNLVVDVGVKN